MSPAKKRTTIEREHPELSIRQHCKLLRLSRLAFYYTSVGIDAETLSIMKEIDRVFTNIRFFGSRQIAAYLRREDSVVGRHRVRRLTGLEWDVPDFSTLSCRQKTLAVNIPYRGSKSPLRLLIDSTCMKVAGGGY